jgi:hypothetical protein
MLEKDLLLPSAYQQFIRESYLANFVRKLEFAYVVIVPRKAGSKERFHYYLEL